MVVFSGKARWTTAWVMAVPMVVVGGYWYLRAMIKTGGNPIPITSSAPATCRRPTRCRSTRARASPSPTT